MVIDVERYHPIGSTLEICCLFKCCYQCNILLYYCRYSREEPFTALNVDVRHHDNLYESLDAFVKGDLLEGANAYHCDKCDKKVFFALPFNKAFDHTMNALVD